MSQGSVAVHGTEAHHPGPRAYAIIALVLSAITLVEFWAFYVPWIHEIGLFMPLLIVLSAVKFSLVAMFYMHLKFDLKILQWLFGFSLVLAAVVIMALFTLFTYNRTLWWWGGVPW